MSDLIETNEEMDVVSRQMKSLVDSGFLPKTVNSPQKAFAISQMGKELGIPPMTAFSSIHVINGKPSLSADAMYALIMTKIPTAVINLVATTNEKCVIEARRDKEHKFATISFTMADAETAGIAGSPTWKKYPRALLRSRCIAEMARALFPDALLGFTYTPEELGGETEALKEVNEAEA